MNFSLIQWYNGRPISDVFIKVTAEGIVAMRE